MKPIINLRWQLEKEDRIAIKTYAAQNDITLEQLAKQLGTSYVWLNRLLSGKDLMTPKIKQKLEKLGILKRS